MAGSAPWWQALVVVGSALLVSSVSLLYRYRQKGHPFGSWAAAKWAICAIVVTAAPAGLALLLPRVPPAYLGVAIPAVLVVRGDRVHEDNKPTENAVWYQVATLGVRLLLDRLVWQMETDREKWVKVYIDGLTRPSVTGPTAHILATIERYAENLQETLGSRASMQPQLDALQCYLDGVHEAVIIARTSPRLVSEDGDYEKAISKAKKSLADMLRLAYDFGHKSAATIAIEPAKTALEAAR